MGGRGPEKQEKWNKKRLDLIISDNLQNTTPLKVVGFSGAQQAPAEEVTTFAPAATC